MPTLRNHRHEKFAQGLAAGKTQQQAYIDAGFSVKHARFCASRLLNKIPDIDRRVNELLRDRRRVEAEATERAIERTAWDKARILSALGEVVERCMQHVPVHNAKGEQVFTDTPEGTLAAAYTFDARGANQALRTIAQMEGLLINTHEARRSPLDGLPPEFVRELRAKIERTLQERHYQIIDGILLPPAKAP